MSDFIDPANQELLKDFFNEAEMQIEMLEQNILSLEHNPEDIDSVNEIFRAAHTLKGSSATVQMMELSHFTHIVEDVLDVIRAGKIQINNEIIDILLQAIDIIKLMIENRMNNSIYNDDISVIEQQLSKCIPQKKTVHKNKSAIKASPIVSLITEEQNAQFIITQHEIDEIYSRLASNEYVYQVCVHFNEDNLMNTVGGIQVYTILKDIGLVVSVQPNLTALSADTYYPQVYYIVITSMKIADIMEKTNVSDVTTSVDVINVPQQIDENLVAPKQIDDKQNHEDILIINEEDIRVLYQNHIKEGEYIYQISVKFDINNPMNTVGGIQILALLKDSGEVFKTLPDIDGLYDDIFFEWVYYIVVTSLSIEAIIKKTQISDVTHQIIVQDMLKRPDFLHIVHDPEISIPSSSAQQSALNKQTDKQNSDNTVKKEKNKTHNTAVLRVESSRIDELLNLVSEFVINKATFNQIGSSFSDLVLELQKQQLFHREYIKDFNSLLLFQLEAVQKNKKTIQEAKNDIVKKLESIDGYLDIFQNRLKMAVTHYKNNYHNFGRITGELQKGVMQIRMLPISYIFARFPRLVRDFSKKLHKNIHLNVIGEETELDKGVIDDLLDPLMHCIRNSLDHGIETPDIRQEKGKSEIGEITLKASNEGNMIVIEISDDGAGIDVNRIQEKAVERGLLASDAMISMQDAFNLIFDAGFSTAKNITDVSGRGVGLDVVRQQIEKLNGTVNIWSELDVGTSFVIKLPLTLAIIQGLMVRVSNELYTIPIVAVNDSHRVHFSEIKVIDNYEIFNLREDIIVLMRLSTIFNLSSVQQEFYYIVVVVSNDKKIGLVVDSILGEEDVVIKPLKDQYTHTAPGIAGANITGDGKISLIIDVPNLIEFYTKQQQEHGK